MNTNCPAVEPEVAMPTARPWFTSKLRATALLTAWVATRPKPTAPSTAKPMMKASIECMPANTAALAPTIIRPPVRMTRGPLRSMA